MESVKNIEIKPDDAGQRLDRFLRKYLTKATLSGIYKMIRKDVKVNGKRSKIDAFLEAGDIITLYLDDKKIDKLSVRKKITRTDRTFKIIYEGDNVLIVFKPSGILTHGDANEKKNHLTVGIGCTGGHHRSVSVTNWLYSHYRDQYHCYKSHRDKKVG